MSRPRKYRLPPPQRMTAEPSPAEIIELTGNSGRTPGNPVEVQPGGGPLDIIECTPAPRKQLVIVLRVDPNADPVKVALSAAQFVSTVQAADRKLRLAVDPKQSGAASGEVTLVLTTAPLGSEALERLEKLPAVVQVAAADFDGATLSKVEIVPQVRS